MSNITKKNIIENFGGGVNSDIAGIYLPAGFVPESLNMDFSIEKGAAHKRRGYQRLGSPANEYGSKDITGIFQTKLKGNWVQLVCAGKDVMSWDGSTTFTDKSGGTTFTDDKNVLWDFSVGYTTTDGHVILLTNGEDQIQKYDGSTLSTISLTEGYNYFKAKYVAHFNNYTIFANTNEGATLADDWTDEGSNVWSYDNTDSAFTPGIEIAEVWDTTTELTESGTPATPGVGEYGVSSGVLYVYGGSSPAGDISITYRNKERIRFMGNSTTRDAEDYVADQFIDLVTQPGREIMRILPLRDLLMVYKEDSIWALYVTGDSTAPFGAYCIDHNTPCIAGFSVADVKGVHFFLSEEGIMQTNGAKTETVLVSRDVPKWFAKINRDNWKYAYAATSNYFKQYRLLVPNEGDDDVTDKDREIRYDYESNTWSEHEYANNANVIATAVAGSEGVTWDNETRTWNDISETWSGMSSEKYLKFYTGGYDGYVREHDGVESDIDASSQAIDSYVVCKPLNLAEKPEEIDLNKKLLKTRARMGSFTASTVSLYKRLDINSSWTYVADIDCGQSGEAFEANVDLSGTCKELQYKFLNEASVQPWSLYWVATEYILRSDR